MKPSKILHIDIDSFFVSAELLRRPYLRGKPVVVMGKGRRAVVSSSSYEARERGIKAGMPKKIVLKLCPECIFIEPDHSFYIRLSKKFVRIVMNFSPDLEVSSIDELFLDTMRIRGHFKTYIGLAEEIKNSVKEKLRLSVSIGIGKTKITSKLATEFAKPNGICELIDDEDFAEHYLLEKVPGIGKANFFSLYNKGIVYGKDLKRADPPGWQFLIGKYGKGVTRFEEEEKRYPPFKSISRGITFDRDTKDFNLLFSYLSALSFEIAKELKKYSLTAKRIGVRIRYYDFSEIEKRKATASSKLSYKTLLLEAKELLRKLYNPKKGPLRAVSIRVSSLLPVPQNLLFLKDRDRKILLLSIKLKEKYGKDLLYPALSVKRKE